MATPIPPAVHLVNKRVPAMDIGVLIDQKDVVVGQN